MQEKDSMWTGELLREHKHTVFVFNILVMILYAFLNFNLWSCPCMVLPVSQQIWTPPPSKWTPRSKSASEYGPGSPYPLANMDLWGSLFTSGFGLPSRMWTLVVFYHCNILYFEYWTESVLNRHKSHLIYFKNHTKILRLKNSIKS
jgi:hypothetical protein